MEENKILVKKKRKGFVEEFNPEKIHVAIRKSAERVLQVLTDEDCKRVSDRVLEMIQDSEVGVRKLHNMVEVALDDCGFHRTAESYRQYRNYKEDAMKILEAVDAKTLELSYKEDVSNANQDSLLVSTKRSILFGEMQKEKYKRVFLSQEELDAHNEGFYYLNDLPSRLSSFNCCLLNVGRIMKGGFKLSNMEYSEPGSVAAALSVASDILSVTAGNQYGGLSWPQVDEDLSPYCEKSYLFYIQQYKDIVSEVGGNYDEKKADEFAYNRVKREIQQGYQGFEFTYNSVSSSRGDFPFISFTFGHGTDRWSRLVSKVFLEVRKGGQGKPGAKIPVLFPKLIFLYDSEIHGEGKSCEDIFDEAVETAKQCMYPDFLSLDAGYIGEVYHKWGKIVSPMGRILELKNFCYS